LPKMPRLPVSPKNVAEARSARQLIGRKGTVWRSDLDSEIAERDAECVELAHFRKEAQRAAQQISREQAARWRVVRERELQVAELRWVLDRGGGLAKTALDPVGPGGVGGQVVVATGDKALPPPPGTPATPVPVAEEGKPGVLDSRRHRYCHRDSVESVESSRSVGTISSVDGVAGADGDGEGGVAEGSQGARVPVTAVARSNGDVAGATEQVEHSEKSAKLSAVKRRLTILAAKSNMAFESDAFLSERACLRRSVAKRSKKEALLQEERESQGNAAGAVHLREDTARRGSSKGAGAASAPGRVARPGKKESTRLASSNKRITFNEKDDDVKGGLKGSLQVARGSHELEAGGAAALEPSVCRKSLADFLSKGLGMKQKERTSLPYSASDFAEAKVKDVAACRRIFDRYDELGDGFLNMAQLRDFLAEVGLRPKNQAEREQLREALKDVDTEVSFEELVGTILPALKARFVKTRQDAISKLFDEADADGSGNLSVDELIKILQKVDCFSGEKAVEEAIMQVNPDIASSLRSLDGGLIISRNVLDADSFEEILQVLQDRKAQDNLRRASAIAREFDLSGQQQELWQERLVDVHKAFGRCCGNDGAIDVSQFVNVVVSEAGMLPRPQTGLRPLVTKLLHDEGLNASAALNFAEVMRLLDMLRAQEASQLRLVISPYARKQRGLTVLQCQSLLRDCGIVPRNIAERQELLALCEEFDEEGKGEVSLVQVEALIYKAAARKRHLTSEVERHFMFDYGWSEERIEEIRTAFRTFDENLNEALECEEIQKALHYLRCRREEGMQESRHMTDFASLLKEWDCDASGSVDFLGFLDLIRVIEEHDVLYAMAEKCSIQKAAVEGICNLWRSLYPNKPGAEGRVPLDSLTERLARENSDIEALIVAWLPVGATQVSFQQFLKIMRDLQDTLGTEFK